MIECDCATTPKSRENPFGICRACQRRALAISARGQRRLMLREAYDQFVRKVLPWILSAVTIWMNVLAGNNYPSAWAVGLAGQAGWLVWIVATRSWGFMPMNIALWAVYLRNHLLWAA